MQTHILTDRPVRLSAGHRRTITLVATAPPCAAPSVARRGAVLPCAAMRTGPTGLDVIDAAGKAFRPTSRGGWEIISNALKENEVKFVSPQELNWAKQTGVPIIDVRPEKEFVKGHIKGSVNVQYYRWIEGWDLWRTARRFMFTFFGVVGTEPNPNFLEEVLEVASPSKGAVLVCNLGGHLDEYGPSPFGYQTRSLMAAYELFENDFKNVRVLKDGVGGWQRQERELVEGAE